MLKSLFITLLAVSFLFPAQSNIDSLITASSKAKGVEKVKLLIQLAYTYDQSDAAKKLETANQAMALSNKINYIQGEATASIYAGHAFYYLTDFEKAKEAFNYSLNNQKFLIDSFHLGNLYGFAADNYDRLGIIDTALSYHFKALEIRSSYEAPIRAAISLTDIGLIYWRQGNFTEAADYFNKALKIREEAGDSAKIASSLNNLGSAYWRQGNYQKAADYFIKSLAIREKIKDKSGMAITLNNIALIYQKIKYYEKAKEYTLRAKNISDSLGYNFGSSYSLYNLGLIHQEQKQYEQSMPYFMQSLEIASKIPNRNIMIMTKNHIGFNYEHLGDYEKAKQYYSEALKEAEAVSDKYAMAVAYQYLGRIYLHQKQTENAREFLTKSVEISKQENHREILKDGYFLFYRLYDNLNYEIDALKSYKDYAEIRDSIFNEQLVNDVANILVRLEIEKTESENELLKKENLLKEAEIVNQRNLKNFIIVVTILAVIIGVILLVLFRLKGRTTKKITEQNERLEKLNKKLNLNNLELKEANEAKNKLFSIIAHDLRSPFNTLLGYSEILYSEVDDLSKDEVKEMAGYIKSSGDSILELIQNLLNWARTQLSKITAEPVNFSMSKLADKSVKVYEGFAASKKIELVKNISYECMVSADINMVDSVMRNFVSNSIKFSSAGGKIIIAVKKEGGNCLFYVEDSGVGISKENLDKIFNGKGNFTTLGTNNEKGTGIGLQLSKEFVEKNNGKIGVTSEEGKGSKFWFTIPCLTEEENIMSGVAEKVG